MRRNSELMKRVAERREREQAAKRLLQEVPELESLELVIHETRPGEPAAEVEYKRYVMVSSAPALFEIPCPDRKCTGGGHDVTRAILRRLQKHEEHFEGNHTCHGERKDGECGYDMHFVASATYS